MKKLLAIVIAMVLVFGISGVAFAQDFNDDSNIITLPLQANTIGDGGDHETEIETGDATGGDHNWAVAVNVPITLVQANSGSSFYDGQSYSFNSVNVNNGKMCATANGGGNANTGGNTLVQKIKQINIIKQKMKELEND